MSIVQISKIQVRRGKKNSEPGVPQLSSAEFAWAVDAQELYIGNGSVAEGAPYVGNTRILTEHDNILNLVGINYRFEENNPLITLSEARPIQDKLDDTVNLLDFLVITESEDIDWDATFANAISQLFDNTDSTLKKTLVIPNGEYTLTRKLVIPSGVRLQGENPNETTINLADQIIEFDLVNRSFDVHFSNLTIQRTTGGIDLAGLADSVFENVTFTGSYVYPSSTLINGDTGFFYWSEIDAVAADQATVVFDHCKFTSIQEVFKFEQAKLYNTLLRFENSKFYEIHTGVNVMALSTQYPNWVFEHCHFHKIYNRVFIDNIGINTLFYRSTFIEAGNSNNQPWAPTVPVIEFTNRNNNRVLECSFDRQAAITANNAISGISEVTNASKVTSVEQIDAPIDATYEYRYLTNLSLDNRFYKLDYTMSLGSAVRVGTLTLVIDDNKTTIAVTDDYNFSPSSSTAVMDDFEFDAVINSNTIILNYINPTPSSEGTITFNLTYGV